MSLAVLGAPARSPASGRRLSAPKAQPEDAACIAAQHHVYLSNETTLPLKPLGSGAVGARRSVSLVVVQGEDVTRACALGTPISPNVR